MAPPQITFWRVNPLKYSLLVETKNMAAAYGQPSPPPLPPPSPSPPSPPPPGAGSPPAPNVSSGFPTAVNQAMYDAFGVCNPEAFDVLEPRFVIDHTTNAVAVDNEGLPLARATSPCTRTQHVQLPTARPLSRCSAPHHRAQVQYRLPRGYIAKIRLDWRNLSPALVYGVNYQLAIFTGTYSGESQCDASQYTSVPCPPYSNGDGVNLNTMGVIAGEEFETKCPRNTDALVRGAAPAHLPLGRSTAAQGAIRELCTGQTACSVPAHPSHPPQELPFWFASNGPVTSTGLMWASAGAGTTLYNAPPATAPLNSFVQKRSVLELQINAADDVLFSVEVRLLDGRVQLHGRKEFRNTMCLDVLVPARGNAAPNSTFHVILPNTAGYQVPLNAPLLQPVQRLTQGVAINSPFIDCSTLPQVREPSSIALQLKLASCIDHRAHASPSARPTAPRSWIRPAAACPSRRRSTSTPPWPRSG